ncbi:hypothetical protein MHK_002523 [Candidatus Magnetomorum sp. HK-1]|nr:hypothetical protein MHK_002523 [Candidatus Magnetomorum sp. HK-1]
MPKDYPNFESLVSSFLSKLDLATKSDVHSLMDRIDQLEKLIATVAENTEKNISMNKPGQQLTNQSISDQVLEILKASDTPMTYAQLRNVSGLDEKPLRNVIYRLNKLGRIETIKRGQYSIPQPF